MNVIQSKTGLNIDTLIFHTMLLHRIKMQSSNKNITGIYVSLYDISHGFTLEDLYKYTDDTINTPSLSITSAGSFHEHVLLKATQARLIQGS